MIVLDCVQVTAAFAPARNEELLQHRGFVEIENTHDYYVANVLEFVKQTATDQPDEEQLQQVVKRPALRRALTEVTQQLSTACEIEPGVHGKKHATLFSKPAMF